MAHIVENSIMTEIKNETEYLSKMRKTFTDKAWFMSLIPDDVTTIIDFGYADNSFINFLRNDYPEYRYIGIEINESFLKASREQGQECYRSLTELLNTGSLHSETTLLVLSSVLHEVYSYGDVDAFWNEVKLVAPKYIALRDMYAHNCGMFASATQAELEARIEASPLKEHYADFTRYWGRADNGYTAIHFLLKYFYDANWKREVQENYIPYHYRELHTRFRRAGYDVVFEQFYGLPYLKGKWHKDFDTESLPHLRTFIDQITTHLKLFLITLPSHAE
jgi:hypothetical protein